MATLREAVDSGRRWRYVPPNPEYPPTEWYGPGLASGPPHLVCRLRPFEALSNNFEIEQEPEKPRDAWLCLMDNGRAIHHHDDPPPNSCVVSYNARRYHDADACDQLLPKRRCACQNPSCSNFATKHFCSTHASEWLKATFKNLLALADKP